MIKKIKKEQLLIGGLFGLLLAVIAIPLPDGRKEEKATVPAEKEMAETETNDLEVQLEQMLAAIDGVGKAEVLITYADSGRIVVEKDEVRSEDLIQETDSNGGSRTTTTAETQRETVYGSGEMPYVVQKLQPEVEGVLVVAEGAGNVSVKRRIQETIEALFGLEAHKISIMKMEVSR